MSHFSKIKTNLVKRKVLIKTLEQMGFECQYFDNHHLNLTKTQDYRNIAVYHLSKYNNHLFSLIWSHDHYSIVADLQLWNLDMDFNYFVDSLSQRYAYNMVVNQGFLGGFSKINENVLADGSIKVVLKRWSNNNYY